MRKNTSLAIDQITVITSFSVLAWSVWPVLAVYTSPLPPLFATALFFLAGFVCYSIFALLKGASPTSFYSIPLPLLVLGTIGITGNVVFFNIGIRHGNPILVNIIAYAWPLLTCIIAHFAGSSRLTFLSTSGLLISFVGVMLFFYEEHGVSWVSGIYAVMSALSWGIYSALRPRWAASTGSEMAAYLGTSAVILFAVSFLDGEARMAHLSPLILANCLVVGLIPVAIGNTLWDVGMARGNQMILSSLSFLTPLLATLWLVLLGTSTITVQQAVAVVVVVLGIALTVRTRT